MYSFLNKYLPRGVVIPIVVIWYVVLLLLIYVLSGDPGYELPYINL